jgi:hypothetical protein
MADCILEKPIIVGMNGDHNAADRRVIKERLKRSGDHRPAADLSILLGTLNLARALATPGGKNDYGNL